MQTVASEHGDLKMIGSGFALAHGGGTIETPPRLPGADTDEVLGAAGYSATEIAAFVTSGVVSKGIPEGGKKRK